MKIVTVVKDAAYRENLEKLLRKLGQEYKSAEPCVADRKDTI